MRTSPIAPANKYETEPAWPMGAIHAYPHVRLLHPLLSAILEAATTRLLLNVWSPDLLSSRPSPGAPPPHSVLVPPTPAVNRKAAHARVLMHDDPRILCSHSPPSPRLPAIHAPLRLIDRATAFFPSFSRLAFPMGLCPVRLLPTAPLLSSLS
ncbi:hypothetical protein GSI_12977 [Ganoderma sinense ZZ0214-1]|uniref:Uncharacterized protein n=1 Tax=Ganoderma sinense ZZ0214-1 TaxID=1077348 RepID=A0A2G8RUS4_9APHY|nr:hypothetical protein GSI_12977 [Ganoderma sinense ZZ0214-1]